MAIVRLTAVAVAELADERCGIERVVVRMCAGASIDFEVAKLGARKHVDEFVTCLNRLLAEHRRVAGSS